MTIDRKQIQKPDL